jgi:hypothetical protein
VRRVEITLKAAVSLYLPEGRVADRAVTPGILLVRLNNAANDWSDGRRNLSVEQFQAAAETIVRNAVEKLVHDYLSDGDFQAALQMGHPDACDKLEDHTALAMARVYVKEIDVDDEHTLAFEIEETP